AGNNPNKNSIRDSTGVLYAHFHKYTEAFLFYFYILFPISFPILFIFFDFFVLLFKKSLLMVHVFFIYVIFNWHTFYFSLLHLPLTVIVLPIYVYFY
ncbi:hypothetical protein ACJX0J_034689, partial [Zea mays]